MVEVIRKKAIQSLRPSGSASAFGRLVGAFLPGFYGLAEARPFRDLLRHAAVEYQWRTFVPRFASAGPCIHAATNAGVLQLRFRMTTKNKQQQKLLKLLRNSLFARCIQRGDAGLR